MKFGLRVPSLKKRVAARTSGKRFVRHSLGLKVPRGLGWLTNPRKAAYNRTTVGLGRGCGVLLAVMVSATAAAILIILTLTAA